jgi:hypothetical protein
MEEELPSPSTPQLPILRMPLPSMLSWLLDAVHLEGATVVLEAVGVVVTPCRISAAPAVAWTTYCPRALHRTTLS